MCYILTCIVMVIAIQCIVIILLLVYSFMLLEAEALIPFQISNEECQLCRTVHSAHPVYCLWITLHFLPRNRLLH